MVKLKETMMLTERNGNLFEPDELGKLDVMNGLMMTEIDFDLVEEERAYKSDIVNRPEVKGKRTAIKGTIEKYLTKMSNLEVKLNCGRSQGGPKRKLEDYNGRGGRGETSQPAKISRTEKLQ